MFVLAALARLTHELGFLIAAVPFVCLLRDRAIDDIG